MTTKLRVPAAKGESLLSDATIVHPRWYHWKPQPASAPDWRRWSNVPDVELWQAVALSCGMEPAYASHPDEEYQRRLDVALAHLSPRGLLANLRIDARPQLTRVTLAELAQLASRVNPPWALPAEYPQAQPAEPDKPAVDEDPGSRQRRRLCRLRELGGEFQRAGDGWRTTGKRGALAELVREEKNAGRPRSTKADVRNDLAAAAMGEQRES